MNDLKVFNLQIFIHKYRICYVYKNEEIRKKLPIQLSHAKCTSFNYHHVAAYLFSFQKLILCNLMGYLLFYLREFPLLLTPLISTQILFLELESVHSP